jgi:hypothetical protein
MPAFFLAFLAALLLTAAGREGVRAARLSAGFAAPAGAPPGLLLALWLSAIASSALAAWAGALLAPQLPGAARQMFVALVAGCGSGRDWSSAPCAARSGGADPVNRGDPASCDPRQPADRQRPAGGAGAGAGDGEPLAGGGGRGAGQRGGTDAGGPWRGASGKGALPLRPWRWGWPWPCWWPPP